MHEDLVTRAASFATAAHGRIDHRRKYTNDPYINHPAAVAGLVATVTSDPAVLAAAWLHDVVEDTGVTSTEIYSSFGNRVGQLVDWLTDVSRPSDGNRAKRKAMDRAHTAQAPAEAQTIKLADLIDNARSIAAHDPDFAKVYMREKRELLKVLTKGSRVLHHEAMHIVEGYFHANPD